MPHFLSGTGQHIEIFIDTDALHRHANKYVKADPKGLLVKKSNWRRVHRRKKQVGVAHVVRWMLLRNTVSHWADRFRAIFKKHQS
jgi:hypothetical protein